MALLGERDAFDEAALLQGFYRNATITMTTPGRLLALNKSDFDELVRASSVTEITAEEAYAELEKNKRILIDCRYDMEFEKCRIPVAKFVPLDQVRFHVHSFDPDTWTLIPRI